MIAEVIKDQIDGVHGDFGTDLFVSMLPENPDNCIALYDEPGTVQVYQNDYGSDRVGLHVLVRGSYNFVKKIWDIHNSVSAYENINSERFVIVRSYIQTVPSQVDIDDKGRRVWSAHYEYLITQKTSNRILI
jgi:hypothetical protein